MSIDNGALEIDHPQLRWDNFIDVFASFRGTAKADVSVLVPRDIALTFGVVSAGALLSGLNTTGARVSTVPGDVVIDQLTGDLELNTVNGEISVSDHRGAVSSHSVSGDVTVSGGHGHLRLYLLNLLAEQPRHGYELIQALSDRFGGTYSPSAGTIYPRLAKLEEEGLVTKTTDGRKTVYEITEAGRAELNDRLPRGDERGTVQARDHSHSDTVVRVSGCSGPAPRSRGCSR